MNRAVSPLVSVIVPIYNTEQYLEECIESLISQTYHPLEVILVDDGSTDSSGKICDRFVADHPFIKVFHTVNQGRTKARIYGVEKSEGEYVAFVDADDYVATEYVEHMVDCLFREKVDISCCHCYRVSDSQKTLDKRTHFGRFDSYDLKRMYNNDFLYDDKIGRSAIAHYLCCKLYSKKSILHALPIGMDLWDGEDLVTLFTLLKKVDSIYISDKPLYYYRQHELQTTKIMDRKRWDIFIVLFQTIIKIDEQRLLAKQLPLYIFSKLRDWLRRRYLESNNYKEFKSDMKYALSSETMKVNYLRSKIVSSRAYYRILIYLSQHNFYFFYYLMSKIRQMIMNTKISKKK